jgi:protein O-mannosyl-transferase
MADAHRAAIACLPWWIPLGVSAAVFLVYANALNTPFVLDDSQIIVHNEAMHHLWPPTLRLWSDPSSGTWGRPVSALTYAINYAIDPDRSAGYHVVNVALHACCALLVLGLVWRTLLLPRFADQWSASAAARVAGVIALLWAIHPLTTDSVTYLSSRNEILFSLFLLLMLYARVRAQVSLRRSRAWFCVAAVSCFLGMGSKEVMVVAPILLLLYDGLFLYDSPRAAMRMHWRFYVALACSWIILAALLLRPETAIREQLHSLSPWLYLKTQAGVIIHYFRLVFWPQPLVIDYFDWPLAEHLRDVLPQAMLIVLLLALTIWGLLRRHWLGFIGAWMFLILAPTSSIYPIGIEPATERRMYLPLAGIVAAIAIGIASLVRQRPRARLASMVGGACVAVVFAVLTVMRNEDFRDAFTLTRTALDARPNNARMWSAHGWALAQGNDWDAALGAADMAVRAAPQYPYAYLTRGEFLAHLHRYDAAAVDFTTAAQLDPQMPEPHMELGQLYLVRGDAAKAEAEFRRAIELYPQWADPRLWLAGVLIEQRRLAEAEQLLAETAREHPTVEAVQKSLAAVRAARKK